MELTTRTYLDVHEGLALVFGRIGRAIATGGRRITRLEIEASKHRRLTRPDVEGRIHGLKGIFKQTTRALRMRGIPNENGTYETGPRERHEDKLRVDIPRRDTRRERREAERAERKASKRSVASAN